MAPGRRTVILAVAALLSAPAFLLSAIAGVYILYSLATQHWYRQVFWEYGAQRALIDILYVAGIVGAASIAAGQGTPVRSEPRHLAWMAAAVGVIAALATEVEFWNETDSPFPRGAFVLPFLAWVAAAAVLRRR
ncbi:MAG: hypothetical protein ABI440_10600 [Casimicrobiaceae bacterium]